MYHICLERVLIFYRNNIYLPFIKIDITVNLYFELQKAGGATGNAAAKKAKTADASASIDVKKEAEEGRVTFFVLVFL